jgi:hypothetical protein
MNEAIQLKEASPGIACLRRLAELHSEMKAAIAAIASNSLSDLEHSLWRQEMICAGLKRSIFTLRRSALSAETLGNLRDVSHSLRELNRSYESLVQQSNRSAALLLDLCRLYTHVPAPVHGTAPNSLSCEA